MSKDKERIISAIVLKYYKAPEKDDISAPVFKGKRGQPPFTRWTKEIGLTLEHRKDEIMVAVPVPSSYSSYKTISEQFRILMKALPELSSPAGISVIT